MGDCMSCNNGCADSCVQTLNVIQSNFAVVDTDSVDLTLAAGNLSADVKLNATGGLESTATGLRAKVDPNPCNLLTLSASGLLALEEAGVVDRLTSTATVVNTPAPLGTPSTVTGTARTITNTSTCRPMVVMLTYSILNTMSVGTGSFKDVRFTAEDNINGAGFVAFAIDHHGSNGTAIPAGSNNNDQYGQTTIRSIQLLAPGASIVFQARMTRQIIVSNNATADDGISSFSITGNAWNI